MPSIIITPSSPNVLISTYWNVNQSQRDYIFMGFSVLISTYWNVNVTSLMSASDIINVLISTYWNVNLYKSILTGVNGNRFNLNLLECKFVGINDLIRITKF